MDLSGDVLKTQEVCQLLRVSRQAIYQAVADGRLPVVKVSPRAWRFRRVDVLNLFRSDADADALPQTHRVCRGGMVLPRVRRVHPDDAR